LSYLLFNGFFFLCFVFNLDSHEFIFFLFFFDSTDFNVNDGIFRFLNFLDISVFIFAVISEKSNIIDPFVSSFNERFIGK